MSATRLRATAGSSQIADLWPALLETPVPAEGATIQHDGLAIAMQGGIVRMSRAASGRQAQTSSMFGYKWGRRDTYESEAVQSQARAWLVERYGDPAAMGWLFEQATSPVLIDAGCGAGYSALALFGDLLERVRYVGIEISEAVDVAARRFAERGAAGRFIQSDLMTVPLREASVDAIFSEGVLHHTDSTRAAILRLARALRPGGRFMFYVYRRKGPIREFTDDYIRDRLQDMTPDAAWEAMMPLTRLGKLLGDLNIEIDVPEAIDLLDIPAGRVNLQRFFYWHVMKAFHRPDMTLDEMNHINFDWYAPRNAHRQSPEEVRAWCAEAGLAIERERVEPAGITIIAQRRGS
jgi:SAM-dependent methyltransferase